MKKSVQNLLVVSNKKLNRDHVLLELKSEVPLSGIEAGQFANILVDKSSNVFLRRPFSIFQADYNCNTISVLIKAIGEGTKCLANSEVGESLSVIFPLGRGYTVPKEKSKVLMVGGGVGIAPLMLLSASLSKEGHQIEILIGAKRAEDLVLLDEFSQYGLVHTTTEDGSHGSQGFVTNHSLLQQEIKLFDMIYTCGPEPMMKAVAKLAHSNNIPCEVSLENTMACGYGVCLCCVTETIQGHRCVCTDGPVFDIKQLKWQN
ncbi:MAG: dihydroorotate dehydrogenase electron transfer subunit [Prolixibacteraceae bacterium]